MKKSELEKLKKETGYCDPVKCTYCGKYYEGYDGNVNIDGVLKCVHCANMKNETKPYFVQHMPTFYYGATTKIFTFENKEDLFNKIKSKISKDQILVYNDYYLMVQNIKKSFWWVIGGLNNFNAKELNIPTVNFNIYNEDKSVNEEKRDRWLQGYTIINNEE